MDIKDSITINGQRYRLVPEHNAYEPEQPDDADREWARKAILTVLREHAPKVGVRDMRAHCWCGWSIHHVQGDHRDHLAAVIAPMVEDKRANTEATIRADERAKHGERIAVAIEGGLEASPRPSWEHANGLREGATIARTAWLPTTIARTTEVDQ